MFGFWYLPVDSQVVRQEIYATALGWLKYSPGAPYPVSGHPHDYSLDWRRGRVLSDFAVILIENGGGEFESAPPAGRRRWEQGEVLILPPGVWHRYRPDPATGWTERWLCLSGELLFRLRSKGTLPSRPALRLLSSPLAFNAAWRRLRRAAARNSLQVGAIALEIMAIALEQGKPTLNEAAVEVTPDAVVNQALEFIRNNCHRPLDVAFVARQTGVIRRTLERRFAVTVRGSIAREIEWARLQRAKQLLEETNLSVKEVGYSAGFSGPNRLIRAFKKRLGSTPGDYRDAFVAK